MTDTQTPYAYDPNRFDQIVAVTEAALDHILHTIATTQPRPGYAGPRVRIHSAVFDAARECDRQMRGHDPDAPDDLDEIRKWERSIACTAIQRLAQTGTEGSGR